MKIKSSLLYLAICILFLAGTAIAAETMSVQVRSGELRLKPAYSGTITTKLAYGDQVNLLTSEGEWRKVTSLKQNKTGWIHETALSEQQIILNPTNRHINAANQNPNMRLAGAGFNKATETTIAEQKKLSFAAIDEMEALSIEQEEVLSFAKSGSLHRRSK